MISSLHLFEGYGVELEYMIVDKDSLSIKPFSDKIIFDTIGELVSDVEFDETIWSKNLDEIFFKNVKDINKILQNYNCMLMPTGMHPFMNPLKETILWPHEYSVTYETYNKIFNCKGHGWANLQSLHLNLPFADDEEFKKKV